MAKQTPIKMPIGNEKKKFVLTKNIHNGKKGDIVEISDDPIDALYRMRNLTQGTYSEPFVEFDALKPYKEKPAKVKMAKFTLKWEVKKTKIRCFYRSYYDGWELVIVHFLRVNDPKYYWFVGKKGGSNYRNSASKTLSRAKLSAKSCLLSLLKENSYRRK